MSAAYVPQVGDAVRHEAWDSGSEAVDITAVGVRRFLAAVRGVESTYVIDEGWSKVETPTPLPERWINVYPNGHVAAHNKKATADHFALADRIILLHVWTDDDGVEHADIERVER